MQGNQFADYALWLQLANDPSQTEAAREQCRARMQDFMRARMRDAFRQATSDRSLRGTDGVRKPNRS